MNFIGIDLGTSSVKLILTDDAGKILRTVSREYPLSFPHPGWSEQDPADWWRQTCDGLRELTCGIPAGEIAGLGIGGQMHGLVALDENDQVIRPAILWNDGRTAAQTEWLNRELGQEKLSEYTGNIAFAGFTAPKLLWMKENEPQNFSRIRRIMLPKDYLVYRMTGVHSCDYSDASGMLLLDVKNKCWSKQMLAICGLDESVMPKLYESSDCVGTLLPEIAAQLGLPQTVKVAAGAGDNAAAAIGTGLVKSGQCNISVGTSGTVFITSDRFRVDENNALHAFAHADGRFHLMGCMLSAASCNKWFAEEILGTEDYAGLQKDIRPERLGENPVFFLPYLMGERCPHNDPFARACFIGMSMDTTRADMMQAVLEGVAFGLRDSVEIARDLGIRIESSCLCGGGAKSPLWRKILANVLDLRLDIPQTEEGPAYGGAMLAAVACGTYQNVGEAAEAFVSIRESVLPEPELTAKYEKAYRKYRSLYPALRPVFK